MMRLTTESVATAERTYPPILRRKPSTARKTFGSMATEPRYKRNWRTTARARRALEFGLDIYLRRCSFIFDAAMGERLREARLELGLTQWDLAKKFNVSQSCICKVEQGKLSGIQVTAAEFLAVLPDCYHYILFGGVQVVRNQKNIIANNDLKHKARRKSV